jgi:HAD superfamily phosphoserine phosphatase-like hydrolase
MSAELLHPPSHEDFFVRPNTPDDPENISRVLAKEEIAQRAGHTGLLMVVDFDKTLTKNGPKDLTSWDVATPFLSRESQEKDDELCATYLPLEKTGDMTEEMADYWWDETLNLYVKDKVKVSDIRRHAREHIKFRDGVMKLFMMCRYHDIPIAIVSAGLGDVIEEVADAARIKPDYIVSTELEAENDVITGWNKDSVVHNHNKERRSREKLRDVMEARPNIILVGDSLEDPKMVLDTDPDTGAERNVIRTRIGDSHRLLQGTVDNYIGKSFEADYDLVTLCGIRSVARYVGTLAGV